MRVIGLMSGTSADAIDAALVEWPDGPQTRPFELLAYLEASLDADLQSRIHRVAAGEVPGPDALRVLAGLDVELGHRFAEAALQVVGRAGVPRNSIDAVASHGQTVAHHPELAASLQIGCASVIAEHSGWPVVADFRSRDLAAGGEGAPLAPFFHWAALSEPGRPQAALNLGGIANLTWLPASGKPDEVIAFDVGPANALLDAVLQKATEGRERFDQDGARARAGTPDEALLAELLRDDYLARRPPKSTGRERYGKAQAEALLAGFGDRPLDDLLATLQAFTVEAIARACRDHLPALPERLLIGGGGVRNAALTQALASALPNTEVAPFDVAGVPADAAEAMAFSLLGRNARLGLVNHLPQTTGAHHAAVLGTITAPQPTSSR